MRLAVVAAIVGAIVAGLALGLLDLIGLITHLAYTGRVSVALSPPNTRVLGDASVLVPIVGGLIVGLMARFGSERIRGHGIPEAMETILLRGSRMEPRLAVLKPISSAVSIGSGGPFGAEGPIIVTGGAVGSITGQLLHLTGAQRRSLLVAGAAAGMTAVFGTPVAAVLLAVELMHASGALPASVAGDAVLIGIACGGLAWIMTRAVYAAEDLFLRLPLHWSWWPALGGAVVGVGGLIDPRVLGAGYGTIRFELAGKLALGALAVLLICKLVVWATALGSNTSGGILAPLLMLGAALGGLCGAILPGAHSGTFALLGMAAAMAGVMRSPLTSVVFAVEVTHDYGALLALLIACTIAHLVSVLTLKRSILTEKIARRGFHVNREYEVDPLQALFVRDVMATDVVTLSADVNPIDLYARLPEGSPERRQRLYPIIDGGERLAGVIAWSDILAARESEAPVAAVDLARRPIVAYADETLRAAADRMAAANHGVLPVVDRDQPARLVGMINHFDLLAAHARLLIEERHRERPLSLRRPTSPTPEPILHAEA
jgi:H+/Cl- antiporter ClcA